MIRVLVADNRKLVRAGWCLILTTEPDIEVVGEARSGNAAVELAFKFRPDVVLMNIEMCGKNGLEATRLIHLQDAGIAVLIVDITWGEPKVRQALECGARGYIATREFLSELVPGVRAVHAQKNYFSPSIAALLSDRHNGHAPGEGKT